MTTETHKKPHTRTKAPPPPVNTPEERRKFLILVVLGCVIVVLLWIATLPFNLRNTGPTAPGPTTVFGVIGQQLGALSRVGDLFHAVSQAKESSQ